jgi:hypothetical protein
MKLEDKSPMNITCNHLFYNLSLLSNLESFVSKIMQKSVRIFEHSGQLYFTNQAFHNNYKDTIKPALCQIKAQAQMAIFLNKG